MGLERLSVLLQAYGAECSRWPAEERGAALALLGRSEAARKLRQQEARLDAVLDRAPAFEPSAGLLERVLGTLAAEGALEPGPAPREGGRASASAGGFLLRRWPYVAAGLALAAAAALWLGRARLPGEPDLSEYQIAQLGTYTMPTDVLLEPSDIDLIDTVPAFGCAGSELACPDFEGAAEPQSRSYSNRRTLG